MRTTAGQHTTPGEPGTTLDLLTISRVMATVAIGVVHTVERAMVGPDRIPTARGNAWAAICADRERASRRDEIRRAVAALAAARTTAGAAPIATGRQAGRRKLNTTGAASRRRATAAERRPATDRRTAHTTADRQSGAAGARQPVS